MLFVFLFKCLPHLLFGYPFLLKPEFPFKTFQVSYSLSWSPHLRTCKQHEHNLILQHSTLMSNCQTLVHLLFIFISIVYMEKYFLNFFIKGHSFIGSAYCIISIWDIKEKKPIFDGSLACPILRIFKHSSDWVFLIITVYGAKTLLNVSQYFHWIRECFMVGGVFEKIMEREYIFIRTIIKEESSTGCRELNGASQKDISMS